jgi:hypothetical protein
VNGSRHERTETCLSLPRSMSLSRLNLPVRTAERRSSLLRDPQLTRSSESVRFTTPYRSWELGKGKTVNYSGNHKKSLHLSVRDSLEKLQTDYIDLLYVHWWVSYSNCSLPAFLDSSELLTD